MRRGIATDGSGYPAGMLRKLIGLVWTVGLLAVVVRRFVPPERISALLEQLRGAAGRSAEGVTPTPTPVAESNGADLHTPLPVA